MEFESYIQFMYGRGDNGAPQTPTNLGITDLTFWNSKWDNSSLQMLTLVLLILQD